MPFLQTWTFLHYGGDEILWFSKQSKIVTVRSISVYFIENYTHVWHRMGKQSKKKKHAFVLWDLPLYFIIYKA